jgi:Leucine-rich repeat (LRR) protein
VTRIYDLYNQFMLKLMDNLIASNPVSVGLLDAIQTIQNGNSSVPHAKFEAVTPEYIENLDALKSISMVESELQEKR